MITPQTLSQKGIEKNLLLLPLLIFVILLLIPLAITFVKEIQLEGRMVYNYDTSIFWSVGRGIINGVKPYSGLFESKPPGIFLVSALSFLLTGDVDLTHWFQIAVLIILLLVPPGAVFLYRKKVLWPQFLFFLGLSLIFSSLMTIYVADVSGRIQTESFGAAFGALFAVFLLTGIPGNKVRLILRTLVLGILIFLSIGFKEPFLLLVITTGLVLCRTKKEYLFSLLLPLAVAMVMGVIVLLVMGSLSDYLRMYLPFMFMSQSGVKDGLFSRTFECYINTFNHLNDQMQGLGWFYMALFLLYIFISIKELKKSLSLKVGLLRFLRLLAVLYLPFLAVSSGQHFWSHHFVFLVPAYVAVFLLFIRESMAAGTKKGFFEFLVIAAAVLIFSGVIIGSEGYSRSPRKDFLFYKNEGIDLDIRAAAAYVDQVMEIEGLDRYLFFGSNGPQLIAHTKHSPMGPYFFQYWWWNYDEFIESLWDNIEKAQLIVFKEFLFGDEQNMEFQDYIDKYFSHVPWPAVSYLEKPGETPYDYYFRRR